MRDYFIFLRIVDSLLCFNLNAHIVFSLLFFNLNTHIVFSLSLFNLNTHIVLSFAIFECAQSRFRTLQLYNLVCFWYLLVVVTTNGYGFVCVGYCYAFIKTLIICSSSSCNKILEQSIFLSDIHHAIFYHVLMFCNNVQHTYQGLAS